jgi:periplasmic protein TonB
VLATVDQQHAWEQARAALAAIVVHALLGLGLVWGLGVNVPNAVSRTLSLFQVVPPPPPPEISRPPPPPRRHAAGTRRQHPGREGAASPPNLRSQASEIMAPRPPIPLPLPSPVVAAPVPKLGMDPSSGNALVRGPGTGSGGIGNGSGSGAGGDGDGGGGYGDESPPRQIRGRLRYSDSPPLRDGEGVSGIVWVRYTVTVDGRATNCRITGSSGSRDLDLTTCRLIEQRFRFEPARDGRGRPIQSQIVENHGWEVREDPDEGRGRY